MESVIMKIVEFLIFLMIMKFKFLLCIGIMGRLGNYLFEFVLGYGIVVKKDMLFVIWWKGFVDFIFELKNDSWFLLLLDLKECKIVFKWFERWCSWYDFWLENFMVNFNFWIGWGL